MERSEWFKDQAAGRIRREPNRGDPAAIYDWVAGVSAPPGDIGEYNARDVMMMMRQYKKQQEVLDQARTLVMRSSVRSALYSRSG